MWQACSWKWVMYLIKRKLHPYLWLILYFLLSLVFFHHGAKGCLTYSIKTREQLKPWQHYGHNWSNTWHSQCRYDDVCLNNDLKTRCRRQSSTSTSNISKLRHQLNKLWKCFCCQDLWISIFCNYLLFRKTSRQYSSSQLKLLSAFYL